MRKKFLALLLALVMVLSLVPFAAFAEGETSSDNDALTLTKNTVLQDDGTYTITLEAYSTGTVTTTTIKKDLPLDIVLVIDQSGSMEYDFGSGGDRQTAMIETVNYFINQVGLKYTEECNSRIALVTFADDSSILKEFTYADANGVKALTDAVSALSNPDGGTYVDKGMENAYSLLSNDTITGERGRAVILFTDGSPGSGSWSLLAGDSAVGDRAIATAAKLKSAKSDTNKGGGAVVYTVGIFDNADATTVPTYENTTVFSSQDTIDNQTNRFMHAVSSNYPTAESRQTINEQNSEGLKYYLTADNKAKLLEAFTTISSNLETSSSTTTLNSDAVLKDILSDNFVLPENYNASRGITVQTVPGKMATDGGKINWGTAVDNPTGVTVTANVKSGTIDVTGFDYANKYITTKDGGEKLVVTISGVELNPEKFAEGTVNTNSDKSGIYTNDGTDGKTAVLVKAFDVPQVTLTSKSYVLDYAKSVELDSTEWGVGTMIHRAGNTHGFTTADTTGKITMTYGELSGSTYTPKTTNWNGYDSFYAFGELETDSYIWSKVNVIPANNVYYEDDFVSTTKATTETTDTSVSIVYNGNNTVSTESAESSETGNGAGVQGWETELADDATFSDGSATKLTTGAKASFTFTGTGVDVYSYTDMTTGVVTAGLYGVNGETVTRKYLMVDNLAVSGKYYQIPTLSFQGLDYGTYTVTLVVGTGNAVAKNDDGSVKTEVVTNEDGTTTEKIVYTDGVRNTYYLDGLRVYNPLGNDTTDEDQKISDTTVKDAYGETELNALFTEVRNLLATSGDDSSYVFIDLDGDGNVEDKTAYNATEYGTYGPKNEVYLAPGQTMTFKIAAAETAHTYQIGLKAPEGATSATWSGYADYNYTNTIDHSTDLYYLTTPTDDGSITISNTGGNLLSVTKIKTTNAAAAATLMLLDLTEEEASAEIAAFSLRSTVAYTAAAEEEVPEETTPEETVPEETTPEETVPEETEPEVPEIDIEIENPTEQKPENKPAANEALKDLVKNLFNKIFGWFGR